MSSMLIRNVGQFWRRDEVFWGRQRNPGKLLGVPSKERKSDEVDFWDQRGIYILYADYHLVYVGQTGDQGLGKRLRQHSRGDLAGRWNMFSWFGIRYVKNDGLLSEMPEVKNLGIESILDHVEAVLIGAAEPPMNSQGGRFGEQVERYSQVRDPRLPPEDVSEVLKEIQSRLKNIEEHIA